MSFDRNTMSVTKSLAMTRDVYGTIIGVNGCLFGQYIRMNPGDRFLLGRDPSQCDVVLNNQKVSAVHLQLIYDGRKGVYRATNKSRSNGTVLVSEAKKLADDVEVELKPGAHLFLGCTEEEIILG